MGNTFERQLSMRKKATSQGERLDAVEAQVEDVLKTIPQLAVAMNQGLTQAEQRLNDLAETVDALVGLVGVEEVQRVIQEGRESRMRAAAEGTKANIAKALVEGKLARVDKVSDKTLIVGRETKADGTEVLPGYAAITFSQVKKEYKEKFLNQAVGYVMDTDGGGKFEVQELYESIVPAPAAVATPTPETAAPVAEATTANATEAGA